MIAFLAQHHTCSFHVSFFPWESEEPQLGLVLLFCKWYDSLAQPSNSEAMFSFNSRRNEYIALSDSPRSSSPIPQSAGTHRNALIVFIALGTTILNAVILYGIYSDTSQPRPLWSYSRQEIGDLRRPSQFIGFDQLDWSNGPDPARKFDLNPMLLMQVDSARPNKVFSQDFAAYRSSVGTIYPETRKVQVTHSVCLSQ
jgi:hypothetical protein